MKNSLLLFLLVVFFFSCKHEIRRDLTGEWYYIDSDSIYTELYFTKELLVYNLEGGSVSTVYFYKIENDSLYVSKDFNDVNREFLFKVSFEEKEEIQLLTNKGVFVLYPIEEDLNVWNTINLGFNKNSELTHGWFRRNNIKLYGSKGNTGQDSLLTIPSVEEYPEDTITH